MLNLAKAVYRSLPPKLRRTAFKAFAALVRNRTARRDLGGYRAELHLGEMMELSAYLDEFEPDMKVLIDRLVKPDMVVLDIGANVGLHALRFAQRVGPGGTVYAFEATRFAHRKLERNIALNPHLRIEPFRVALSNENLPGIEVDFRSSWLTAGGRADPRLTTVDFARLDDWVRERGLGNIDLIKLDVDGYEGLVLDGARETIAKFRPDLLIEAWTGQFGLGRLDPFRLLASLGYTLRLTNPDLDVICPDAILSRLNKLSRTGAESFNVYAVASDPSR